MPRLDWRHQYDDTRDEYEGEIVATVNNEPSLTQQHFTEDADLNVIIRRYGIRDGALPPAAVANWLNVDLSELSEVDLRTALDRTRAAEQAFQALPAELRSRFDNNVGRLWSFITNPANLEEAERLGLLQVKREAPPAPPSEPPTPTT